jgi:tetratricopeptide (TPR) repeat protein
LDEQSGDLAAAKGQFEKVVLLAPDIAAGHSALGSVLLQLGEYQQAIREFVRAIALNASRVTSQGAITAHWRLELAGTSHSGSITCPLISKFPVADATPFPG